ncbi:MAG: methyltransferase domain-containing protein [Gammaproteobacteria bacterium]|nr:methyltransferase domain-containing protein [Gammaproteobacteria bacterium]
MELKPWPEGGLESIQQCPVCGVSDYELLYPVLQDKVFGSDYEGLPMVRCVACDSAYLQVRPNEQTIGLAYQRYYTHEQSNSNGAKLSPFRRLIRATMNSYRNRKFGLSLTPSNLFGYWLVSLLPWLSQGLINEIRSLPKPLPGQRLLDVGCGNGKFLVMAKAMGWEVVGVDFDELAVNTARKAGLTVVHGDIFSITDYESFDYITCSHVIEHVHHPKAFLQHIFALLKPSGNLWLETPNIQSYGHEQFGADWRGLEPPRHLVLFNNHSLTTLLRSTGFTDIHAPATNIFQIYFIYAASEAIKKGRDASSASFFDGISVTSIFAMLKSIVQPNTREYITISAVKGC